MYICIHKACEDARDRTFRNIALTPSSTFGLPAFRSQTFFLLNITQQAMNKYYRKVIDALKTNRDIKALGFSRKELKGVAANIANKLQLKDDATDDEVSEGISDAIDDVLPLLQLTQSAVDRQVSEYKSTHSAPDDDDVLDDEPDDDNVPARRSPSPKGKKGKKDSDDDQDSATLNAIKELTKAVATLQGDVTALKSGNTTNSRTAKVRELLKDTGKFGERELKSFSRMKFENEDEFEDYLEDLKENIEEENKERLEKGLDALGRIPAPDTKPQPKEEDKLMSDDEVKKLAKM